MPRLVLDEASFRALLISEKTVSADTFHISPDDTSQRLDRFLANQPALSISRSMLKRLIDDGEVRVNGQKAKPSYRLQAADIVSVRIPAPKELSVQAENIPLKVLYEDADLIVVNKPSGMVVHPSPGHDKGTLVHALLHHCDDLSGVGGVLRPGIVHRLDKDTSGVMVAAKHDEAHQGLADLFKHRPKEKLDRRYLAVAQGSFREDEGTIDTRFGRHPTDRKRYSSKFGGSRQAITHFWVRERFSQATLLELKLETGRTHQIRVHLSDRHRSLIGDGVYGGRPLKTWPNALRQFPRQALHAFRLSFTHPISGEWISCEAEPPDDFQGLLEVLRRVT